MKHCFVTVRIFPFSFFLPDERKRFFLLSDEGKMKKEEWLLVLSYFPNVCAAPRRSQPYAVSEFFQKNFSAAASPLALKYPATMRCTVV
jgi:hypothetical protein